MTKPKDNRLRKVLEALVGLVGDWNDIAEDGDRGRDNTALVLELHDDGSGRLSTSHGEAWDYHDGRSCKIADSLLLNPQCEFANLDELEKYLAGWLEIEPW